MEEIVKSLSISLLLYFYKAEQAAADVLSPQQLRAVLLRGFNRTEK